MDERMMTLFCVTYDLLKAMNHREDSQCHVSDAEVMTAALIAAFFGGNWMHACRWLHAPHYIPRMLGKSRFNRRMHRVEPMYPMLFVCLSEVWRELNVDCVCSIDTFPIPVCDNVRISLAKIYRDKACRGYIPSRRRYFCGLKIHLMVTEEGQPDEFFLTPGSLGDGIGLDLLDFGLPPDSIIYADRAYNSYYLEDLLQEANQTALLPMRKKGSTRPPTTCTRFLQYYFRKRIDTSCSLTEQMLPRSFHAVTAAGFELKVVLFVIALSVSFLQLATWIIVGWATSCKRCGHERCRVGCRSDDRRRAGRGADLLDYPCGCLRSRRLGCCSPGKKRA